MPYVNHDEMSSYRVENRAAANFNSCKSNVNQKRQAVNQKASCGLNGAAFQLKERPTNLF